MGVSSNEFALQFNPCLLSDVRTSSSNPHLQFIRTRIIYRCYRGESPGKTTQVCDFQSALVLILFCFWSTCSRNFHCMISLLKFTIDVLHYLSIVSHKITEYQWVKEESLICDRAAFNISLSHPPHILPSLPIPPNIRQKYAPSFITNA